MKILEFSAPKGGVGTTTVACATALGFAKEGKNVLLIDLGLFRDTASWLGLTSFQRGQDHTQEAYNISVFSPWYDAPNVSSVTIPYGEWDVVVVDAGRCQPRYNTNADVERIGVLHCDYMSLRNATAQNYLDNAQRYTKYVVTTREGNVLTATDALHVLGSEPVIVPMTDQIARSIDAGLCASRTELFQEWVALLLPLAVV